MSPSELLYVAEITVKYKEKQKEQMEKENAR